MSWNPVADLMSFARGCTTPVGAPRGEIILLGYACVSKAEDQDPAAQVVALKAAGCERVDEERASGGRWDQPKPHRLLDHPPPGDVLVVWKLDRLSRSLKDLLRLRRGLIKRGRDSAALPRRWVPPRPRVGCEGRWWAPSQLRAGDDPGAHPGCA